jgi:hypothetical protein
MDGHINNPKLKSPSGLFWLLLLLLGGTLAVLCHQGFLPYNVFWANDSALGAMQTSSARLPGTFTGYWGNFWWIGGPSISPAPSLTTFLMTVLSPANYLKIYAPTTMLFLGFCVWFFFRQLRFAPMVCVIAGLGAGLNMHYFSNACWGLGTWCVSAGMILVALGILVSPYVPSLWTKGVLAGLSVGMAVMEGFDVGALLSIYLGIFVIFLFLTSDSNKASGLIKAIWVEVLVVLFAVCISASTLYTLVGTQITGTANADASTTPDDQWHWDWATQFSLPKLESFRLIIPGLYGYRLQDYITSTNHESVYWGSIGEDPRIGEMESSDPKTRAAAATFLGLPQQVRDIMASTSPSDVGARENILDQLRQVGGILRHTGSGDYTGVLVCFLALFGLASSVRKTGSPYSDDERRGIWFWTVAALFSLFAAWGRHSFVYALIYRLPYFSTIRNPIKFLHPLNICFFILSGYGLEALYRNYLRSSDTRTVPLHQQLARWWKKAPGFDKGWIIGSVLAVALFIAAFLLMNSSQDSLAHYLEHHGFDEDLSPRIAAFSIREVGLFLLFFGLSAIVLVTIISGAWSGKKIVWAWSFLSAIMICDLSRADLPWIRYYNYHQKYSMNPVVDFLRQDPWEHRVASRLSPIGAYDIGGSDGRFGQLAHWWLENDYPFNDIQSLEIDQSPRMAVMESSYIGDFNARSAADLSPAAYQWVTSHSQQDPLWRWVVESGPASRLWKLTNTRYLFADANMIGVLNQYVDPPNSFRAVMRLNIVNKPGIDVPEDAGDLTVESNSAGSLALIEFTRALPRAKLYSDWKLVDDATALQTLASTGFDSDKTVLVATNTPVPQSPSAPGADPGTVAITQYHPKDIILQADAKVPSVLLFNDRTGDFWNVWVDQKPEAILRCNYIMRGVFVPVGRHTIELRYQPPLKVLFVSLAAVLVGILLGGFVLYNHFRRPSDPQSRSCRIKIKIRR